MHGLSAAMYELMKQKLAKASARDVAYEVRLNN